MTENLRLVLPQWPGGMNANYQMGAKILEALVPESSQTETLHIPVDQTAVTDNDRIDGETSLLRQMQTTADTLRIKQPQRVITLGGDCSISEAPFDYLHGKYPDDLGIIWLDAHPDASDPDTSHHIHEMVVANLMQKGAAKFNQQVRHPFTPKQVLFAGLQTQALRPMDHLVSDLQMAVLTPADLATTSDRLLAWFTAAGIKHVALHLDLDVLDPDDFRSVLPAEPGLDRQKFGAAIGSMKLATVSRVLQDVSAHAELVGLSIAEHMPWDAINLHNELQKLAIFK
ncbi:arginase family protein [Levilactobacillus suantsaii]|uniref:Arginase family protein n=1 Tax=Levilactobacillus suantsaii TaxID=2292255 RepID=A0A4Q0VHE1_9LACO|nr:arginase family protein [Levilactobacillus suantsaii]QMU07648.1 arginase family protein [Levilactobacillus suantsaii]RXI78629.1 arginase family protein [Levilactobacillus suantsaii]